MKTAKWLPLILMVVIMSSYLRAETKTFVYLWTPRTSDVGGEGDKGYVLLRAILRLTPKEEYRVVTGDSIDFIIRKRFLVSSRFSHAYQIYLARILELNPGLTPITTLTVGRALLLPSGPKFAGTELGDLSLPAEVQDLATATMLAKAFTPAHQANARTRQLAVESLKYYVSSNANETAGKLLQEIKDRGIVYPIAGRPRTVESAAQVQPIVLQVATETDEVDFSLVKATGPQNILPGMFPVSDPVQVNCSPQKCVSCKMSLKVPENINLNRARLLVIDTGISPGIVDSAHIVKQSDNDDAADQSSVAHGTFVYSEIAVDSGQTVSQPKLFGVLPKQNVYVSRAVQAVGADLYFTTAQIINAWTAFSLLMNKDSNAATTRVVNVSAFGEPILDPAHPPAIPYDGHLLLVAAAGNTTSGGSSTADEFNAFARLSSGATPVIIVGALGTAGTPAFYSNFNPTYVQLFAPGDCVCGAPGQLNGTSQATPFIATAAAIVSAQNPDWGPLWVMWRLISTSDPGSLSGRAVGGTVNLSRALDRAILLEEDSTGAQVDHRATSVTWDSGWKTAFSTAGINTLHRELLRLHSRTADGAGNTCFSSLEFLFYPVLRFCVPDHSQLTIVEAGVSKNFEASQVTDLVVPVPSPTDKGLTLPNVFITGPIN